MKHGIALFRHGLSRAYLKHMAWRRRLEKSHADLWKSYAANEMDAMHATYLKGCSNALSRIEGMDIALGCLGYEWDDLAGRYSEIP